MTVAATDERPTRRRRDTETARTAAAAALPALALAGVLRLLFDWHGLMSSAVWAAVLFLVATYALVREQAGEEAAADRTVTVVVWTAAGVIAAALVWMLAFLVARGARVLRPSFFTQDMATVGPLDPGGGALHAMIGTLEQVGIATAVVVPIAVLTAVYLHELKGRMAGVIRFVVDAMSGLPSIVAGLLVFTVWVLHHGFSGLAGSAALAVLMLPTVTRASEEILRTIPDSLREASIALGAPEWRVVLRVVLPTALSGLVTGVILGVARAVGETAPMLLTALGSDRVNTSPVHGPQADLPTFVWKLVLLPNKTQQARGFGGALVLVGLVLVLFLAARLVAARSQRMLGGRR